MSKSKVYYTKSVDPESVVKIYDALKKDLQGNIAIKFHSGEAGNKYFLKPDFFEPIVKRLNGTLVETNTAYPGQRNTTEKHLKLLETHGWTPRYKVDILDSEPEDLTIEIPTGKQIKKNILGKKIKDYDSMVVVSHYKGHPETGFGGAIKQLSIGCASHVGKCNIHSGGRYFTQNEIWKDMLYFEPFQYSLADAAKTVCDLFKDKIVFINVMKDLSIDCDCEHGASAPVLPDMGIFASEDPVAIDQACCDKIANCNFNGRDEFMKRINDLKGPIMLEESENHGIGKRAYEIINID